MRNKSQFTLLYFDKVQISQQVIAYYAINIRTKEIILLDSPTSLFPDIIISCLEKKYKGPIYFWMESYQMLLEFYELVSRLNVINNSFSENITVSHKLTGTRLRNITLKINLKTLLPTLQLNKFSEEYSEIKLLFFDLIEESVLGCIDNSVSEEKQLIFSRVSENVTSGNMRFTLLLLIQEYLQILEKVLFPTFSQLIFIFDKLKLPYLNFLSLPSQALKLWNSLDNKRLKISPIEDSELESFIRFSYRGGLIYLNNDSKKGVLDNVYHYDIISQSPTILLKSKYKFPIELSPVKETNPSCIKRLLENNTLGFIKVKITYIRELSIPFLKRRFGNIDLSEINFEYLRNEKELSHYYPALNETWIDIYTSIDILYASKLNAYKIEFLEGYFATRSKSSIGKNFVKTVFPYKEQEKNNFIKNSLKIVLNSLIGKFGQKAINEIYTISNFRLKTIEVRQKTFVHLASCTTAYARCFIHEISMKELVNQNIIYYINTDSIFCSKIISKYLIKTKFISTNRSMGKFRLKEPFLPNQYIFVRVNNFIGKSLTTNNTFITSPNYSSWADFQQTLYNGTRPFFENHVMSKTQSVETSLEALLENLELWIKQLPPPH